MQYVHTNAKYHRDYLDYSAINLGSLNRVVTNSQALVKLNFQTVQMSKKTITHEMCT